MNPTDELTDEEKLKALEELISNVFCLTHTGEIIFMYVESVDIRDFLEDKHLTYLKSLINN